MIPAKSVDMDYEMFRIIWDARFGLVGYESVVLTEPYGIGDR